MNIIGIDIGSLSTKVALVQDGKLIDYLIDRSTYRFKEVGLELFNKVLEKNGLKKEQIDQIMSNTAEAPVPDKAEENEDKIKPALDVAEKTESKKTASKEV